MSCANCEFLREERDEALRDINRLLVEATGLARSTISTCVGLLNSELRARKIELRECTDLARRKRLVARVEQLRAALADIDTAAVAAGSLRRDVV